MYHYLLNKNEFIIHSIIIAAQNCHKKHELVYQQLLRIYFMKIAYFDDIAICLLFAL